MNYQKGHESNSHCTTQQFLNVLPQLD